MEPSARAYPPTSTYRLQLRAGLPFDRIRQLADYFEALGVGSLYLSPLFRATAESSHGYDIVDPTQIDPRLGTLEDLTALSEELSRRGMGLIIDIVPNHMSTSPTENAWWRDVLENGERSPKARIFDIDWHPSDPELEGKVMIPALGESLGDALEQGKLRLERGEDGFSVVYGVQRFPLAPESWIAILRPVAGGEELRGALSALDSIVQGAKSPLSEEAWREQQRGKMAFLTKLEGSPDVVAMVDRRLAEMGRDVDTLSRLLERQFYRLCHWREANDKLNYRRFFDINDLVGVHVEDREVFRATHSLVSSLVERGSVHGLRVDHVDGLSDPEAYLESLPTKRYIIVEKVLEGDEPLRDWPIAGTTGYDTLNSILQLFVHPSGRRELTRLHRDFTGVEGSFEDSVYESKKLVLETSFRTEVSWLAEKLGKIVDGSLAALRDALIELAACFPTYRTYVSPESEGVDARDRDVIERALSEAKQRNPGREDTLLDDVARVLTLEGPAPLSEDAEALRGKILVRFQQLTGPAMAKGVEDTAFYRYYPLVSLNEVGGGSGEVGDVETFHERNLARARTWPGGLVASSTHDTKRGEDVRARIHVLSEDAERWKAAITRWRNWNRPCRRSLHSREVPDRSEEYLFYQMLLGSWPLDSPDTSSRFRYVERVQGFMLKALREAKRNTNWVDPDTLYEAAVLDFVTRVLDRDDNARFLEDFVHYEGSVRRSGLLNALSQLLLKATVPGVPDFYQGTELFQLLLTDPDNRRQVDFDERRSMLTTIDEELAKRGHATFVAGAMNRLQNGRLKFHLTRVLCRLRRDRAPFFRDASYRPLLIEGVYGQHVIAFLRASGNTSLIVAAGRWFQRLAASRSETSNGWKHTLLRLEGCRATRYREILTDRILSPQNSDEGPTLSLDEVFRYAPLALLETIEG